MSYVHSVPEMPANNQVCLGCVILFLIISEQLAY